MLTALEYQLHPVTDVLAGTLLLPAGHISEMLQEFVKFVAATPDGKSPTLEACDRIGIKNSTILVSLHACRY